MGNRFFFGEEMGGDTRRSRSKSRKGKKGKSKKVNCPKCNAVYSQDMAYCPYCG